MSISPPDPEGPLFDWFIKKYHKTNSKGTKRLARQAETLFQDFIECRGVNPKDVDEDLALEFVLHIKQQYSPDYQRKIVGEVDKFYSYCLNKGIDGIEGNPVSSVIEDHDPLDTIKGRDPYMISEDDLGEYVASFDHPGYFTPIFAMVKTTRRIGEVINLDLQDIHLSHPSCSWDVHPKIRHHEDYIRFGPEPTKGEMFRGEERHCSNKTETERIVPIDDELRNALLWYLLIRQGSKSEDSPLFKAAQQNTRLHKDTLSSRIRERSKSLGYWYGKNDDDNINSHYFRHWSTTTLRDRSTGDTGLVQYLRGDKGSEMKDRYTHWTDSKEEEYLEIVPKFYSD